MVNSPIFEATMGVQQWDCSQCCFVQQWVSSFAMQQWCAPLLHYHCCSNATLGDTIVALSNIGIVPIVAYVQDLWGYIN
jgi:hypothetical protein